MSRLRPARRAVLRVTTSPKALRSPVVSGFWKVALGLPGLPEGARSRLADAVHTGLLRAGRPKQASAVSGAAVRRLRSPRLRAEGLVRQAYAELETGTTPRSLPAAVAAELNLADDGLARGAATKAAGHLQAAQRLLFSRRLHFDRLSSPLAEAPTEFLAPWRASAAVRALAAPRGRSATAAAVPTDRPIRLLIATYGNQNFLDLIRRHFAERADVELRFLDLAEEKTHVPLLNQRHIMTHVLAGKSAFGDRVADWLQPQVDWADVVFVDWCAALAGLFTLVDPGSTRMIVRLHSFETFTAWPHVVDFSRVDDLIFVSDLLRDLTLAAVPALTTADTRVHVVTNAMDLRAFGRAKDSDARFTLGLVGIKAIAKDPRWAIEVLRCLRTHDERFKLALFGKDLDAEASPDVRRYWDAFLADIAQLAPSGAVVRHGQVADMPGALTGVGIILSSSVRESFHCGLVEGAASGAVPVVRDWPFFAGKPTSARTLFPADWMVDTPEEAAQRILAVTATEESWRKAGEAAAAHAIELWDWQQVRHDVDRVVTGTITGTPHG